jgi:general secretion pathway protein J
MKASSRTYRSARGFTLVEILVAIGILATVLVAIFSSWTAILRATKVRLEAAATVQRARVVAHVLEDSLSSAQLYSQNQQFYSFVAENGESASLSFVARLSKSFPRSGKFGDLDLRRLTFSLEQGPDGRQLVLRQNPLVMELDADEKSHPVVLAKHVKEFDTQFWDARLADWIDEWTATNSLPPLVKVTVKLTDNAYSSQVREEITRIVSLPATAVPGVWQTPRFPGGPAGQQPALAPPAPGQPNQPGVPPRGTPTPGLRTP